MPVNKGNKANAKGKAMKGTAAAASSAAGAGSKSAQQNKSGQKENKPKIDRTTLNRLTKELKTAEAELKKLSKRRGDFASEQWNDMQDNHMPDENYNFYAFVEVCSTAL